MPNNKNKVIRNKWFYSIELLLDILIITISYYYGFRIQRPDLFIVAIPSNVIITLIYIGIISLILLVNFKIYRCGEKPYSSTIFYLLLTIPIIALSSVIIDFIIKGVGLWRKTIFYAICIQIPAFLIIKFITIRIHKLVIKLKISIIVGATLDDALKLSLKILDDNYNLYDIRYLARDNSDNLYNFINQSMQVIICSSCEKNKKTKIIEYCAINNIDCIIVPSFNDIVINSGKFNNRNDTMFLDMAIKLDIESRFIKRTIDIIISSISLLILSPLMIAVATLIKLQDGGKPIYSQKRLSRNNREFNIYKFRTMIEDAEKGTGAVLATINDSRITKLGKFLRASRIDEIPQLFNVLKGEMSLVGPRPERPDLIKKIVVDVPEFRYRTLVKAGVTGLAQTMGRYDTEFKDKLLFDLFYVNNYSIILDLKIMFYTLHTLIKPSVTLGINNDMNNVNIKDALNRKGYSFQNNDDYILIKKK